MKKLLLLIILGAAPLLMAPILQVVTTGTTTANDPSSIAVANQKVWYRSDSMVCTSGCSGTNVVTSLTNKFSGTNACTTANSPTYLANVLNGQPGVTFNGTSQTCSLGSTIAWNGTTHGITVFSVASYAADLSTSRAIISGNSNSFLMGGQNNGGQAYANKVGVTQIGTGNARVMVEPQCEVTTYNSSTGVLAFYLDGNADGGATNAQTISAAISDLFFDKGNTASYFKAKWIEIAVWDTVISSGDIATLQTYCNSQYGMAQTNPTVGTAQAHFAAGASDSITFTGANAIATGDTVVVWRYCDHTGGCSAPNTMTDTATTTWTCGTTRNFAAHNISGQFCWGQPVAGNDTITSSWSGTVADAGLQGIRVQNLFASASALDVEDTGTDPGFNTLTVPATGTITTTHAKDVIFGAWVSETNSGSCTSLGNYTVYVNDSGYWACSAYRVVNSTGIYQATANGPQPNWLGVITALKSN